MLLEVRDATPSDAEFAWALYGPFVKDNLFTGQSGRPPPNKWHDAQERAKFDQYYQTRRNYVVDIDGEKAGWMAVQEAERVLSIENAILTDAWRNKGVIEKFVSEMLPIWKQAGLIVEAPILDDTSMSAPLGGLLARLGFKKAHSDGMCTFYQA